MFGLFGGTWKAPSGERVVRKGRQTTQGPDGASCTYEIWTAPNAESAKAYLNSRSVTKPFHYVVVETDEGNWAKDRMGVYRE